MSDDAPPSPDTAALFAPLQVGAWPLAHRVVLAPLTRLRARQPGNIPHDLNAEYYAQRSTPGGLLISEATQIEQRGQGYPQSPGIHTDEQVVGWKLVTDAVHARGGLIVLQLWHVGRISHPSFQPNHEPPIAPSAIKPSSGRAHLPDFGRAPFETPRALRLDELPGIVAAYRDAAQRAQAAGFDGVEIHGANGYLLEQFMRTSSNVRTDAYGGSVENRARLPIEVAEAVVAVWGAERVGMRLSPFGSVQDAADGDTHPLDVFRFVMRALSRLNLAYVHLVEPRSEMYGDMLGEWAEQPVGAIFREDFANTLMVCGGYDGPSAASAVDQGHADVVAFGRWFISNPDLPERIRRNAPLNAYDRDTFYGGGAEGYTDYPTLSAGA